MNLGLARRTMTGAVTLLGILLLSVLLSVLASAPGFAASYGDLSDPSGTVFYENISDINGLYGAPTVSVNSLDFTPDEFIVNCTQCPGGETTADTITLDIRAVGGQQISEISANEGLNYIIQSFSPAGFAAVQATSTIFVDILEVNGQSINGINASVQMTFDQGGIASVSGFGTDSGIFLGATGAIDIQQIIQDAGGSGEATLVRLSLDNTLQAFHDGSGGQAFLRKRDTDFLSITINGGAPIPEPSTGLLLLGGLTALSARRTRR